MRSVRLTVGALIIGVALAVPATAAWGQYQEPTLSPTATTTDRPPSGDTPQPTLTVQGGRTPRLGVTGADIAGIAAIGAGSLGLGGALVVRSRRRRSA